MVRRFYVRELLGFEEVDLEIAPGLVVFSGPSGAGKSVLLSALLSLFGYPSHTSAALSEAILQRPEGFEADGFDLDEDELILRQIKKEKIRYFLNAQSISKKRLKELFAPYVRYISARDQSGLESDALLRLIDRQASKDASFKKLWREYRKRFKHYEEAMRRYESLQRKEREAAERREFLRFEIEKINAIRPKVGEVEELMEIKKRLSRLDKLKEATRRAEGIFAYEGAVTEFYELAEGDASLFDEAMNRLRADMEAAEASVEELEGIDVEGVLDRLGELNGLMKRFGSIEEALAYKAQKEQELAQLEHIETDKTELERFLEMENAELHTLAGRLSAQRQKSASVLQAELAKRLSALKLPPLRFVFHKDALRSNGMDRVDIDLEGSDIRTLSGGEFNRVRLALMALGADATDTPQGVLVLDEIDANVSGEESIAIAELLETLAQRYQIFAISHQPHLTARAHQHLLVEKTKEKSTIKELNEEGRIAEIARIIGGENPSGEARTFARKLRAG